MCRRAEKLPTCHRVLQTPHLPARTHAPLFLETPCHPVCWKFCLFFMLLGLSLGVDSSRDLAFSAHLGVLDWETSGSERSDLSCSGTAELPSLLPFCFWPVKHRWSKGWG